jgi:peroxiredoxin
MNRDARRIRGPLIVAILSVAATCCLPCVAATLEIGSVAPDFNLPGVDGKNHSLEEFRGADILVVIFTCNHCPTAQAYEDRLKQLAADYQGKNVAVVAISPNDPQALRLDELGYTDVSDSLEEMKIRAKDMAFNFPYLYDGEDQKVSRAYGPATTPHVFVFDRARKLRFVGRIDNSDKLPQVTSHETRDVIEAEGRDTALRLGLREPDRRSRTRNVTSILKSPVNLGRPYQAAMRGGRRLFVVAPSRPAHSHQDIAL